MAAFGSKIFRKQCNRSKVPHMILIALGSNLPSLAGAPVQTLRAALMELARADVRIVAVSSFYRTVAWPDPADPSFVNAVARVETGLSPQSLIARLHEVERVFGRTRGARNAPRTLDLDLLDYDGRIEAGPPTLPHPRISSRDFVLVPLRDVAPEWRHPIEAKSVDALIAALPANERAPEKLA
ncbi:MAG: 2-amino-4-hydroxy-6-hydroxymethyldihydropteridine diphosphokinase [Rhizomicrobium sp.]